MSVRSFENAYPIIPSSAYIDESAVVIGNVTLGEHSSIWPFAVVRGDINHIKIGARSNIQDGTIVHVTHAGPFNPQGFATDIGDDVTVGHQVVLHGCTIQNEVLVGIGSRILDGAVVESQVYIGAGSLVPPGKVLESGYLWLGSPVQKIRKLTQKELDFLAYSAKYYANLAQRSRLTPS